VTFGHVSSCRRDVEDAEIVLLYVQWPFFLNFWVIYHQKNVVEFPTYQSVFGIKKMFTFDKKTLYNWVMAAV